MLVGEQAEAYAYSERCRDGPTAFALRFDAGSSESCPLLKGGKCVRFAPSNAGRLLPLGFDLVDVHDDGMNDRRDCQTGGGQREISANIDGSHAEQNRTAVRADDEKLF